MKLLIELELEKPVKDIASLIASRIYMMDGINTDKDVKVVLIPEYQTHNDKPT